MHFNYELMQDELREMWESVNDFNAQIQAFIAFLTFSDIYVCFTLFSIVGRGPAYLECGWYSYSHLAATAAEE
jgi:hypothetical protein